MNFNDNSYSATNLTVNLQAITDNYLLIKSILKPGTELAGVVKANSYGLGSKEISKVLIELGCSKFYVANLDEALRLRNVASDIAIYVLNGLWAGEEEIYYANNLFPVINNPEQFSLWEGFATSKNKQLDCLLHIDTGINRVGFSVTQAHKLLENKNNKLNILYLMSHLVSSEEADNPINTQQKELFDQFHKYNIPMTLSNSGGIFLGQSFHYDLVRPGAALYGLSLSTNFPSELKNVVTLSSKIIHLNRVENDGTVGYNQTYAVKAGAYLATLPVGYADGLFRSQSNRGCVYISGQKVPIVGLISMDFMVIDVSDVNPEHVYLGSRVDLINDQHNCCEVAREAGVSPYQVITNLGKRYFKVI